MPERRVWEAMRALTLAAGIVVGCTIGPAGAQPSSSVPPFLVTPDRVQTSIGTLDFGPTQPAGIKRGNWIQTMPGKGWFRILRLYSPLESFFDKTWRPSEIELHPR